jgi:hypothetical protein
MHAMLATQLFTSKPSELQGPYTGKMDALATTTIAAGQIVKNHAINAVFRQN